jgi:AraC-like DNA-binding protein
VDGIGQTALDLGLRGAAAGLFLMIVAVLLRSRPLTSIKWLSAAMSAGGAVYMIVTAPFVPKLALWWTLPVIAANPVVVWLWAQAAFEDDFAVRRWHGLLWLGVVGIGLLGFLTWTIAPMLAKTCFRSLSVVALIMALLTAVQTVRTWSADLVARRRRLRLAVLVSTLLFIGVFSASDLMAISSADFGLSGSLLSAIAMLTIAALGGWGTFQPLAVEAAPVAALAADAPGAAATAAPIGPPADADRDAIAPGVLRRLDHLMTVERIYRQEGLTIGMLAAKFELPEYRLRQAINEGLGYRNFNAFLNHYRLADAKAALADPSQREVPVLTIALDAGFQSIGPFNRAFKADTGVTPTEFRRDALAATQTNASTGAGDLKIGQTG